MPVHCPGPPPGRRGGNVSDEPAGGRNTFLLFAQILSVQPGPVPDPAAALSQREAGGLRRPEATAAGGSHRLSRRWTDNRQQTKELIARLSQTYGPVDAKILTALQKSGLSGW